MRQEEILQYNKRCAEFLGWKETSEQFKIDWCGCKTKERLEKINKQYIPILEKDGDVLFPDFNTVNFYSDWNWIKSILEKISSLNEDDFSDETQQAFEDLLDLSLFSSKESICESINNFIKTIK